MEEEVGAEVGGGERSLDDARVTRLRGVEGVESDMGSGWWMEREEEGRRKVRSSESKFLADGKSSFRA